MSNKPADKQKSAPSTSQYLSSMKEHIDRIGKELSPVAMAYLKNDFQNVFLREATENTFRLINLYKIARELSEKLGTTSLSSAISDLERDIREHKDKITEMFHTVLD